MAGFKEFWDLRCMDWVLLPFQEYFTYMDTSPFTGEGLQNLSLCSAVRAFEQGGIFIVQHMLWHCLLFCFPFKNISLTWRHHYYRWRATKFKPMLGGQGLWAGRDLYSATHAVTRALVTRALGLYVLIRRTTHSVAYYDTQGDVENLF
jgi:hypothetical protein